jgi:SOS-response transcriptional repressor LexA
MKKKINYRQAEVFDFIVRYKTDNDGLSPTYREIGEECGISSTSVVRYYLVKLQDGGLITFGKKGRGIKVIGGRWSYE